ncbi:MAG: glutamyl-tRNA reductase, partial [Pirellulales bacterium]|nr:glutamyl-tRNA reductase [Pirellulales bacterium]
MKLQLVGCSHHTSGIEVRERIAFSAEEVRTALDRLRDRYPKSEAVLLSTCNRVELYTAGESSDHLPTADEAIRFLAEFHGISPESIHADLFRMSDEEVLRHLFRVAASLDSMVVGEPQILSQVKEAYQQAIVRDATGPITHAIFQAAVTVARRVANETTINQRRVSIPSLAVADFAKQIFEEFHDKHVLVIGAGEMAEETLLFLKDEGATDVTVINRNRSRADELANEWQGRARDWSDLAPALVEADLV